MRSDFFLFNPCSLQNDEIYLKKKNNNNNNNKNQTNKQTNKRLLILIINRITDIVHTTIMIIDHAGYGKRTLFTVDFLIFRNAESKCESLFYSHVNEIFII